MTPGEEPVVKLRVALIEAAGFHSVFHDGRPGRRPQSCYLVQGL